MKIKLFLIVFFVVHVVFSQKEEGINYLEKFQIPMHIRLDLRHLDYRQNSEDLQDDTRFQFSYFKIDMIGRITKNLGARLRFSPASNGIATNGLLSNVNLAHVDYTSDNGKWYFEVGKSFMFLGTAEQQYLGGDVYNYSIISNNLNVYKTGVTAQYTINEKQVVGFQVLNSEEDQEGAMQELEYNAYWFGKLGDKIDTYFSGTVILGQNQKEVPYVFNGGFKFRLGDYHLDTDAAILYNFPNFYKETMYYSFPIQLAKVDGNWSPIGKYIYNIVDPKENVPVTVNGDDLLIDVAHVHTVELGLQYYPKAGKNLRFHLVSSYTFDSDIVSYTPPNSDPNSSRFHYNAAFQIILGCRIAFDPLHGLWNR
ncbi:MAG: hypothetical protein ACPGRE_08720 [Flavobacteriaceae bacterium]